MEITRIVTNSRTKEKIKLSAPVNEELFFDGGVMITETDTKGIITYANRKFRELTGFSQEELVGASHSINRHPDMPKGVYRGMWAIISEAKIWNGYIKNLCKDGRFYWVHAFIQPKFDDKGTLIGYVAARKPVDKKEVILREEEYNKRQGDDFLNDSYFMNGLH